jgi:hypothetical protein
MSMRRRDFLTFASTGLFASLLPSQVFAQAGALVTPPFSIGYWSGTLPRGRIKGSTLSSSSLPFFPDMAPAEHPEVGDTLFLGTGVRVSLRGLYPRNNRTVLRKISSLAVTADYRPFHAVPLYAWQFRNQRPINCSSPISFTMPVSFESGLKLYLELATSAAPTRPQQLLARFTLGQQPALPKLLPGTYCVAFPSPTTGLLPFWQEYQLRPVTPAPRNYLFRLDPVTKKLVAANFPYLLLSVSHPET